ncbi:hypothetical protein Vafri_1932 [Volvox africanus]|nr:hypothetical protein Vafri_1932 [Volvox africanus]
MFASPHPVCVSGPQPADPRVSFVRKARRQLHDALLRSLYSIASSGHCQKPQQVIQEALRDAGDAAMEQLAAVLRGRQRTQPGVADAAAKEFPSLTACCAASYLLWLIASGDFSPSEASELNTVRARMAKEAPSPHERDTEIAGGGGGGGSRYAATGFGVVQAVAELLLVHLPVWRNPVFGDCVPAVGTTLPPPPLPPAMSVDSKNGDGSGGSITAHGTVAPSGGVAAGAEPTPRPAPQYGAGSGGVSNGATMLRPPRASLKVAGNAEDAGGDGNISTPQTQTQTPQTTEAQPTDPRVAHGGNGDAPATVRRVVPPLPVSSMTGLLLTPRDNQAVACSAPSPQERYGRGDSSDDGSGSRAHDGNSASGDGSGRAGGVMRGNDSSGTADHLSTTQDLDLSNVIDSSVELTGKEQLMQLISAAGSALLKEGELGHGKQGREGMVSEQREPGAEHTQGAGPNGDPADGNAAAVSLTAAPQGATANTVPSDGPTHGPLDRAASPSDGSDAVAGSGCTPLDAPASGGGGGAARLPLLTVARPTALILPTDPAVHRAPPPRPSVVPTPATWLSAVRFVRKQHTCVSSPTAAQVQELQTCCMGLLSAISLSAGGSRAVCSQPNLLPYIASLLELPDGSNGDASPEAAALGSSGHELRWFLLPKLRVCSG